MWLVVARTKRMEGILGIMLQQQQMLSGLWCAWETVRRVMPEENVSLKIISWRENILIPS